MIEELDESLKNDSVMIYDLYDYIVIYYICIAGTGDTHLVCLSLCIGYIKNVLHISKICIQTMERQAS